MAEHTKGSRSGTGRTAPTGAAGKGGCPRYAAGGFRVHFPACPSDSVAAVRDLLSAVRGAVSLMALFQTTASLIW